MKKSIIKKIITCGLLLTVLTVSVKPQKVEAVRAEFDYDQNDTDDTYGTSGKLRVKSHLIVEVPFNPCSIVK